MCRGDSKEGVGCPESRLEDMAPGKHKEDVCYLPEWRIGPGEVVQTPGKTRRTRDSKDHSVGRIWTGRFN